MYMYDLAFEQQIGIFFLILMGYSIIVSLIVLLFDNCANNKLDFAPIFWTTFFLSPLFGALMAIVNIISKQDKEPKTLANDK